MDFNCVLASLRDTSPDQCNSSFQENRLAQVVNCTNHPHINAACLRSAVHSSVPAGTVSGCVEYSFAPTIVDAEVVDLLNTYCNWTNDIISAIIVRGKGCRNKNVRICFKHSYCYKCRIRTVGIIPNSQFIPYTIRFRAIYSHGVSNIEIVQTGIRSP